jgi:hypothetical protein
MAESTDNQPSGVPPVRRFPRCLRVVLLPVAVLAIVAGSSASASAATLTPVNTTSSVTVSAGLPSGPIALSMKY